jgi:hypothetical protein
VSYPRNLQYTAEGSGIGDIVEAPKKRVELMNETKRKCIIIGFLVVSGIMKDND